MRESTLASDTESRDSRTKSVGDDGRKRNSEREEGSEKSIHRGGGGRKGKDRDGGGSPVEEIHRLLKRS